MIARNLLRVLQQACHRIKTSYGVLRPIYGNEEVNELLLGLIRVTDWALHSSI